MTNDLILKVIKRACPRITKIVVEPNDVSVYLDGGEEAFGEFEFVKGSKTRRAIHLAGALDVGTYTRSHKGLTT